MHTNIFCHFSKNKWFEVSDPMVKKFPLEAKDALSHTVKGTRLHPDSVYGESVDAMFMGSHSANPVFHS
jgi:hypothetical protein